MPATPSLGDLTFEVDPRREWTPPHADSLESKLFDSPRTTSAYLNSNPYRPNNYVRPPGRTTPDVRASDAAKPQGQPQPQPQPQLVTLAPAYAPPALAEPGRVSTPRRSSPTRVVYIEPSLSQLPSATPSELPSVRGQTLGFAAPSAVSSGNINSAAAVYGGTTSARRRLAAQGTGMAPQGATGAGGGAGPGSLLPDHLSNMSSHQGPDPVDTYLVRFQLHQRIRESFRVRQDEHLRTVQELGAKIQAMTRTGSPQKSAPEKDKDKEADAATAGAATTSSSGQDEAEDGAERGGKAASASAGAVGEEGALEREASTSGGPAGAAAGGAAAAPASPSASAAPVVLSPSAGRGSPPRIIVASAAGPPPLPDPPLGRNRFLPLPLGLAAGGAGGRRHSSTSANGDLSPRSPVPLIRAGSARPAAGGGGGGGGGGGSDGVAAPSGAAAATSAAAAVEAHLQAGGSVSQLQSQLQLAHQLQNQGAYLALPDGSFAGTAPFRAQATTEGLLFERYTMRKGPATGPATADLPDLQLRYLRPPTTAPPEPKVLRKLPRTPQPPIRALPNGIPASRLERLSARRRNRSPQRPYQQWQQLQSPHRSELVLLSGATVPPHTAPASLSGGGVSGGGGGGLLNSPAALEEGLLRSISMIGSPTATAHGGGGGGISSTNINGPLASSAAAGPYGRNSLMTAMMAAGGEGGGALAHYLSVPTAPSTGEPLLDDNFYEVLSQHFRSSLHQQTAQLRAQLNVNLPVVLKALNCVNTTEPLPPPVPLAALPGAATAAGAAAGGGAVASRLAR